MQAARSVLTPVRRLAAAAWLLSAPASLAAEAQGELGALSKGSVTISVNLAPRFSAKAAAAASPIAEQAADDHGRWCVSTDASAAFSVMVTDAAAAASHDGVGKTAARSATGERDSARASGLCGPGSWLLVSAHPAEESRADKGAGLAREPGPVLLLIAPD